MPHAGLAAAMPTAVVGAEGIVRSAVNAPASRAVTAVRKLAATRSARRAGSVRPVVIEVVVAAMARHGPR